jgi:muramidase (phage lysozyme)
MDASVPRGAALLLAFVYSFESGNDYTVVYGHHQSTLAKPITAMTLDELAASQKVLAKRYGSSAAGAPQFMPPTIADLRVSMKLTGKEVFSPSLQDRMGYALLQRRGYAKFKAGQISVETFAKNLAMEWASLPVLVTTQGQHRKVAAGETYYAGDKLNRALVAPDKVRTILAKVLAAAS